MTGSRAIGPENPPPVLNGQRQARPLAATRQQANSSWPPYHSMLERVDVLERAPDFFPLPESMIRKLARRVRQVMISAGGAIVYQGEPGDIVLFIQRGRMRVVIDRPTSEVTVAVVGPRHFLRDA